MNFSIPTIFILFLIFVFLFQHHLRKQEKSYQKANKEFWDQENKSLVVRKKDIDSSRMIVPDMSQFPKHSPTYFEENNSSSLYLIQEKCIELSKSPMMNVGNLLNSEIRLQFGTANLPLVQSYEENYHQFLQLLFQLGEGYYKLNEYDDSIQVLKVGMELGTDLSKHYILLGTIYHNQQNWKALNHLIKQVQSLDSLIVHSIIKKLQQLQPY